MGKSKWSGMSVLEKLKALLELAQKDDPGKGGKDGGKKPKK